MYLTEGNRNSKLYRGCSWSQGVVRIWGYRSQNRTAARATTLQRSLVLLHAIRLIRICVAIYVPDSRRIVRVVVGGVD
jgi:hypothetical protein